MDDFSGGRTGDDFNGGHLHWFASAHLHWTRNRTWDNFGDAWQYSSGTLAGHSIQDGLHYAGHVLGHQGVGGWVVGGRRGLAEENWARG